jgi:hypothetical protein
MKLNVQFCAADGGWRDRSYVLLTVGGGTARNMQSLLEINNQK